VEATLVEVEVAVREAQEDKNIIVGLPDTAVRESSERVNFALLASGCYKQSGAHVINLAPADLRKEGPAFDLPIALGMAICGMRAEIPQIEDYLFAGELSLDGSLRPIKGVLALAVAAKKAGKKAIILPHQNAAEAALISGLAVFGVRSLAEAWKHLSGEQLVQATTGQVDLVSPPKYAVDFSEVKGQAHVTRAIETAEVAAHTSLRSSHMIEELH